MIARKLNDLFPKLMVSAVIVLICIPLLERSLWVDEAMLFSNYPLQHISAIFGPLPFYDQASSPLYSTIMTLIGTWNPIFIRGFSQFLIFFALSSILLKGSTSWKHHVLVAIIAMSYPSALYMMSELKHYSLESVGAMLSIVWLIKKSENESIQLRDIILLSIAMSCGISTIVIALLCLFCYLILKRLDSNPLTRSDYLASGAFLALSGAYYILIKHITAIQIANYPEAYASLGVFGNLKGLKNAFAEYFGKSGEFTIGIAFILLLVNKNATTRKLIAITCLAFSAFVLLCAFGKYPASYGRHVAWALAFGIAVTYYGLTSNSAENRWVRWIKILLIALLCVMGAKKTIGYWTESKSFELVNNKQALKFLAEKPPSKVGLWFASQPVVKFYSKVNPELRKHQYFGLVNDSSMVNEGAKDSVRYRSLDIEKLRKLPGAWSRGRKYWVSNDFSLPAQSLISEAPRDTPFYLFFSHYSLKDTNLFYRVQAQAIDNALENAGCNFSVAKEFKFAVIYQAVCAEHKTSRL